MTRLSFIRSLFIAPFAGMAAKKAKLLAPVVNPALVVPSCYDHPDFYVVNSQLCMVITTTPGGEPVILRSSNGVVWDKPGRPKL